MYRALQILQRPLEDLSSLLGFDIPSSPLLDLANIKADGVIIHWSLPEKPKHKKEVKFEVLLNGTIIDRLPCHESAVTITGLQPGSFYVVRVALLYHEFGSKSPAVRFRTKPASSEDFFNYSNDSVDTENEELHEPMPRVRPYRELRDFTSASPTSTVMTREPSSGLGANRNTSRRPSPAAINIDHSYELQPDEIDPRDSSGTVPELTERLNGIRREIEEAERLAVHEEDEEFRQKDELAKERDELKGEVNEKEKTSKNLKREVNALERQNTAAQNERAKQERALQSKKQERQRMKDDMVRWEGGVKDLKADVERIQKDKASHGERAAREKVTLRARHEEETNKVRALDDEVKEKTAEIKKLERMMKDSSPNGAEGEPNLVQQLQHDADEERKWQALRQTLQQQYSVAFGRLDTAKRYHADQMRYLESLRADRRRQEEMAQYAPPLQDRPRRADSQRSRHAPNRHSVSDSPRLNAFPVTQSPFQANANPATAGFNASPFFNIHNGMTLAGPTDEVTMSDEDRERLTGGAAMSPSAGAGLIPADLFSGEGESRTEHVQPLPGLGSLPGLAGLPGPPSQAQQETGGAGPASPTASSSRSPSVFASPQASQHNLHIGSPDLLMDADRRSIRSTRSSRAPSGGTSSRFSGMFGIKQRSKNTSEDGPPLSKSSSMPRQDQGLSGLDSATRKRNSSISGAVLGSLNAGLDSTSETPAAAAGKRAFGFFSKDKAGGWPASFTAFSRRPASPRPGSTHSNELPRPSMDSSRWGADAWSLSDATAGARGSPLAFGSGWNAPGQQSRIYGSRHPSRRPSVQYGASGPPEDIMEDEDDSDLLDPDQTPHLPPIGTKPSKKAESGAKLNPNAKDFKSFFSSIKFSKDKGKDGGESSEKNEGDLLQPSVTTPTAGGMQNDESPPNSRKSRDTRSMTTEESSINESGRDSPDLARTPSYSNSDVPAPSPSLQGKESFMQKISRKSSSSKFSLPSFKREKSRLDAPTQSNASTPVPAEEDEEEPMSESVGSLADVSAAVRANDRDSKEGNRGSRSWSSAFKLGKKKGNEASDRISMASGTEDGEEDEV